MPPIKDTIEMITSILFGVGVLVGGVGYLKHIYSKSGKDETSSSAQLASFWKEQVEGFKIIVADQTEKIRTLTGEIGELRGQITAEKKQNELLERIFQNRDPETKKFMELMMQAMKDQSESHKLIVDALGANGKILSEIHTMSKAEHERDFKVEATVTKA